MRNVALLTQAPTGTVGTVMGTSTGIEPFFQFEWTRTGRMGTYRESAWVVDEWRKKNPGVEELPPWFVHAMSISPEAHILVQAQVQHWTDNPVSKTVNLPETATVDDVRTCYEMMYRLGCKGGTVYRDKCRMEQVLHVKEIEKPAKIEVEVKSVIVNPEKNEKPVSPEKPKPLPPMVAPHPQRRAACVVTKRSSSGETHITMTRVNDEPFEVFMAHGKSGSDTQALIEALGRTISLFLRISSPYTPLQRVRLLASKLMGIGGREAMRNGRELVRSIPDGIAKALAEEFAPDLLGYEAEEVGEVALPALIGEGEVQVKKEMDACPSCGDHTLVFQGGCSTCLSCGQGGC